MSAALTAQPGLYRATTAVSAKVKSKGRNRKRKKSTMAGGACATACTITLGPGYITCAGLQALADQGDHRPAGLPTLWRERVGPPTHADWDYHKAMDLPTMQRHILTCTRVDLLRQTVRM